MDVDSGLGAVRSVDYDSCGSLPGMSLSKGDQGLTFTERSVRLGGVGIEKVDQAAPCCNKVVCGAGTAPYKSNALHKPSSL